MPKFAVLTLVGMTWENTWTETIEDETVPLEFASQELADKALDEYKKERLDAGMDFNADHYLVCELLTKTNRIQAPRAQM